MWYLLKIQLFKWCNKVFYSLYTFIALSFDILHLWHQHMCGNGSWHTYGMRSVLPPGTRCDTWARVCSFPASAHSAINSPLAHEGTTLRDNRPEAFREAFLPSSGPGGYPSPTSPQSLSWFWNNQPKDSRSSLRFWFPFWWWAIRRCTCWTLLLNSEWLRKKQSSIVLLWCLQRSSSHVSEIGALSSAYALEINILSFGVKNLLGAPEVHPMGVDPELWVDCWK
jgi:hypothetical protein